MEDPSPGLTGRARPRTVPRRPRVCSFDEADRAGAGSVPAGAGAAAAAAARCGLGGFVGRGRRCGEREPPTHPLAAAVRARELGLNRRAHGAALLEGALATQADVLVRRHRPPRIARGGGTVNRPLQSCSPSCRCYPYGRVSTGQGQSPLLTLALRLLGWVAGWVQNSDHASEPGFAMSGSVRESLVLGLPRPPTIASDSRARIEI